MATQQATQAQAFTFTSQDIIRIIEFLELGTALSYFDPRKRGYGLVEILTGINDRAAESDGIDDDRPDPRRLPVDVVHAIATFSIRQRQLDGGPEYEFSAPIRRDRTQEAAQ